MPAGERAVDPGAEIAVTRDAEPGDAGVAGDRHRRARGRDAVRGAGAARRRSTRVGPRPDLIGTRIGDEAATDGPRATVDAPGEYAAIAEGARVLPALVSGDVEGLAADTPIAIAVNGEVVATTRVFPPGQYVAIVPPDSLRPGANDVAVLQILPAGLRKIGANRSITRS